MLGFSRVFHVSSTLGTEFLSSFVMGTFVFYNCILCHCCMHAFPKSPVTQTEGLCFVVFLQKAWLEE